MKRITLFVFLVVILPLAARADGGRITGRVSYEKTSVPISAALIKLTTANGNTLLAESSFDGEFWFANIPKGTFHLSCTATGLDTFELDTVCPKNGDWLRLIVPLKKYRYIFFPNPNTR